MAIAKTIIQRTKQIEDKLHEISQNKASINETSLRAYKVELCLSLTQCLPHTLTQIKDLSETEVQQCKKNLEFCEYILKLIIMITTKLSSSNVESTQNDLLKWNTHLTMITEKLNPSQQQNGLSNSMRLNHENKRERTNGYEEDEKPKPERKSRRLISDTSTILLDQIKNLDCAIAAIKASAKKRQFLNDKVNKSREQNETDQPIFLFTLSRLAGFYAAMFGRKDKMQNQQTAYNLFQEIIQTLDKLNPTENLLKRLWADAIYNQALIAKQQNNFTTALTLLKSAKIKYKQLPQVFLEENELALIEDRIDDVQKKIKKSERNKIWQQTIIENSQQITAEAIARRITMQIINKKWQNQFGQLNNVGLKLDDEFDELPDFESDGYKCNPNSYAHYCNSTNKNTEGVEVGEVVNGFEIGGVVEGLEVDEVVERFEVSKVVKGFEVSEVVDEFEVIDESCIFAEAESNEGANQPFQFRHK